MLQFLFAAKNQTFLFPPMPSALMPKLCKHLKTVASFGAIQVTQTILPLLALPWLARILGPDSFGLLMYFCLLPPMIALIIDWGQSLYGARKAAWQREDKAGLAALLGQIISAKIMLATATATLAFLVFFFLPHAATHPWAYAFSILAGMARGLNPLWFFQGWGKHIHVMAWLEIGTGAATLAFTFLFIRQAEEWPFYLLLIALFKFLLYAVVFFRLWLKFRPVLNFRAGWRNICSSAPFFGSSFCQMVCCNGSQLVLGHWLPATIMGNLAACMKMLRAFAGFIQPFTQTIFPEACILANTQPEKNRMLLGASLSLTFLCAVFLTALLWITAPWLIQIALGDKYGEAIPILRIMLLAAPFMAANNVMATQILAANQLEKLQFLIICVCACASLPMAALAARLCGVAGGAFLLPFIEFCLSVSYLIVILKFRLTGLNLFRQGRHQ